MSRTILIFGDWVVDEYWFLVRHHSEISSHTGFVHYRIASRPEEIVSDLCGAGHVARTLYTLRREVRSRYKICGLGSWADSDTSLLRHLIHSHAKDNDCQAASANFRLKENVCRRAPARLRLSPLFDNDPTTRVVRLYHQEDGGLQQINRIDWEIDPHQKQTKEREVNWHGLGLPEAEEVDAVVVHDLRKGVVTPRRIQQLKDRYEKARWYVRSKSRQPSWLDKIEDTLELLVVGPEVATLLNPWDRWLVSDRITFQGIQTIDQLPGRHVVLLSDQREVLARVLATDTCITAKAGSGTSILGQLGWPSATFAGLILRLLDSDRPLVEDDFVQALQWADEQAGVRVSESLRQSDSTASHRGAPQCFRHSWSKEERSWTCATDSVELGLLTDEEGQAKLEVWRGSTLLPGYVVCVAKKQEIISKISQYLLSFRKAETVAEPLGIMLQADPGAGKTFLAKSLEKAFGFSLLRFDITQMIHREELLNLFDQVATRQTREEPLMVFVDEINAELEGSHVYGAFLAPLEEGFYVRRGHTYTLKPCVWIFAGTRQANDQHADKLDDFRSRMTLWEKLDYASLEQEYGKKRKAELEKEARLEQVYLGASMLRRYFSDVRQVSREVLRQFYDLDPRKAPARTIRRYAASLKNVQYGQVTRQNCDRWSDVSWGHGNAGREMVRLVF